MWIVHAFWLTAPKDRDRSGWESVSYWSPEIRLQRRLTGYKASCSVSRDATGSACFRFG